jgi:uncharacterized coiled-coil protein SlyX
VSDLNVQVPTRLKDLLGGVYYGISITAVLIGLIAWVVIQQDRINALEAHEKDHPTKAELSATAIRIDNRIAELEKDHHEADQRIQDIIHRLNEMQSEANRVNNSLAVIVERQNVNTEAIRGLQLRLWSYGGSQQPNTNYPDQKYHEGQPKP